MTKTQAPTALTLAQARRQAAASGLRHGGYCAMPHPTDPTLACHRRPWEHDRPGEADTHVDTYRYTVPGDVLSPHPTWTRADYA